MKRFFLTSVLASVIAMPAFANDDSIYSRKVNKASVVDIYQTVTQSTPTTTKVCWDVEVPIYGNTGGGASAGDVLGGMIIGGLLGKGASGNDNGAAAGAVIGGMIAADNKKGNKQIVGYKQETRCKNETTYENTTKEVYSHSVITFYDKGKKYKVQFVK